MPEKVFRIVKSKAKNKKYTAIVGYKNKRRRVNFGQKGYTQYKDSTGLGLYSKNNNNDKKRRKAYFKRHSGVTNKSAALKKEYGSKITAKWLSHKYLW